MLVLCILANWQPWHIRPHNKITLDDAPLFAAVLLLPAPLSILIAAGGKLPGQLRVRKQQEQAGRQQPWFVIGFNLAFALLQVRIGTTLFAMLRPDLPFDPAHLTAYAIPLIATAVAMYTTNAVLLAGAVGLQRRLNPLIGWWASNWRGLIDRAALYAIGYFAAVLGIVHWWALLIIALPMVSTFLSFDYAARAYLWREAATRDVLTTLYNRLHFFQRFATEQRRAGEQHEPCSLILIDLDDLKGINDRFGHLVGDQAIQHVAEFLRAMTRVSDVVARIGGDEFAILLPQTPQSCADALVERMKAAMPITWGDGAYPPLTFSIGVANVLALPDEPNADQTTHIQHIMRAADHALYREKVRSHEPTSPLREQS